MTTQVESKVGVNNKQNPEPAEEQKVLRPLREGTQRFFRKALDLVGLGWEESIVSFSSGDEDDFRSQYIEHNILGEGEFGSVKVVEKRGNDESDPKKPLACKFLKKGLVLKDNILHTPLKPEVLKRECEVLKTLKGKHYTVNMMEVFESSNVIFIVTQLCTGQDMFAYQKKNYPTGDMPLPDVSRIAFQLLDAVSHCAAYNIIHRDIKPDNIMFETPNPGSDLRLIDFGSCAFDRIDGYNYDDECSTPPPKCLDYHTTYAGAGFYNSPEMFQRKYTQKTDVWSAGVVLYVLVAGYPAIELQKAFDHMQKKKRKKGELRDLPQMPSNVPETFIHLLDDLLEYQQKDRKTAEEILKSEFIEQFYKNT